MFAEKHYPELLQPEELDLYLSSGWYRMGQSIFTTHFLCFGQQFYSAVWVRLPLDGYQFSKSLRKLWRKTQKQFHTEVRPASINLEKEILYQHYKSAFEGILAPSLKDSLLDGEDFNIFNTYEVAVYHDDALVALSYFDLGKESAASILGIYHPDYAKHSLGFYSMLAEITYCRSRGIRHYYPGYVVPGYDRFDYKLRIGDVEYYDLTLQSWLPFSAETASPKVPLHHMDRELVDLERVMAGEGFKVKKLMYPLFEANLFGFWTTTFFDYPVFLQCLDRPSEDRLLVVVYDVRASLYKLIECVPFEEVHFYFNESYVVNFDRDRFFLDLLVPERVLGASRSPEGILAEIKRMGIPVRSKC